MISEVLCRKYGRALFLSAQNASAIDEVLEELTSFSTALNADSMVKDFYYHPVISWSEKIRLVDESFKVHLISRSFLILLFKEKRMAVLSGVLLEYKQLLEKQRSKSTVKVTTRFEITPIVRSALVSYLTTLVEGTIELEEYTDPDLIGGIMISVQDRVYDGTVSGQLRILRKYLNSVN